MAEISPEALARACDYDHQHRPRDGAGWTRVPDHQIRRLLDGLAEQGLITVRAEDINAVLGPNPGLDVYVPAGRRLLDAAKHPDHATPKETDR